MSASRAESNWPCTEPPALLPGSSAAPRSGCHTLAADGRSPLNTDLRCPPVERPGYHPCSDQRAKDCPGARKSRADNLPRGHGRLQDQHNRISVFVSSFLPLDKGTCTEPVEIDSWSNPPPQPFGETPVEVPIAANLLDLGVPSRDPTWEQEICKKSVATFTHLSKDKMVSTDMMMP